MLGTCCPYSTPLDLRLGLLPGPGSAPLGLAGRTVGARRRSPRGRDGWDWPGRLGRGAKSFWRQVVMEMAGASSPGKTSDRKSQYAAITKKESYFAVTIPGKRRPGRRVG